ncbi:TIGR03621 family F420-dependent LLM class oxidoreductase [Amycolatopsis sp. NPDC059021]|uniref:TIGR03621 family F420-dependent LLM class oxidoreductase n=1 Tax=Amycolatopsis sp. NPDC059021 TaxID=3346704 RepID=UPI003671182C
MTTRPFRFGVNLLTSDSRTEWQAKVRQAEELGYHVLNVPDHLGRPAPFPALTSAAEVTTTARLGTYVLNAGFYRPALLAREAATVDLLSDGRLEIGLGAGYVQSEFEAAGLPFPSPGERLDHLVHTVTELRRLLADHQPPPTQRPAPPIMIAGQGKRLLRAAAEHADIVGIAGALPLDANDTGHGALAEKIELVRSAAGPRAADLELNLLVKAVARDAAAIDLSFQRRFAPELSDEQLLALPGVLCGSPSAIVDTLHEYREKYGITYFTVLEFDMAAFAEVIAQLR